MKGEASPLVARDSATPDKMQAEAHTDLGKAKIEKGDAEIFWYDRNKFVEGIADIEPPENCHLRVSVFVADTDTPEFAKSTYKS